MSSKSLGFIHRFIPATSVDEKTILLLLHGTGGNMVPFEPETLPDLTSTSVFIGAGRLDPIASPDEAEWLAEIFENGGADVTVHWEPGGHEITAVSINAAQPAWLLSYGAKVYSSPSGVFADLAHRAGVFNCNIR